MSLLGSLPDFEIGTATDVGLKRKGDANQDSLRVIFPQKQNPQFPMLVVADGMGGHGGGSTASRLVVESLERGYQGVTSALSLDGLVSLIMDAHLSVREKGSQEKELSGMGSTVVACVLFSERLIVVNVGDSRIYRFRGKEITRLSQDQSWVGEQIRAGILTPKQARTHPFRNRLTMSISAQRADLKPYAIETDFRPEDIILLCSDGLWGTIPDSILWAVASELPPQEASKKLVALANTCQGPDNISAIVARRRSFVPQPKIISSMDDTNSQ
jgi:PPM family protein phosphatase